MKLTKSQIKAHQKACELLKKDILTGDDKIFVIENWNEGAEHINSLMGAFFTPYNLARHVEMTLAGGRAIDLCAGIGILAFCYIEGYRYHPGIEHLPEVICLEINPDYIEIGKKICPEAKWIQGSIFDRELIESLGYFDVAFSNPPFGNIKSENTNGWLNYTGGNFELKAVEVASKIAESGSFILPRNSSSITHAKNNKVYIDKNKLSNNLKKFLDQTKITMHPNLGIDCDCFIDQWRGVKPEVEIACFMFEEDKQDTQQELIF